MSISQAEIDEIRRRSRQLHRQQVAWRRHLHQYPELSGQEHQTTAYLTRIVKELGLRILPINLETGLLAELGKGNAGPIVAVRTDIDALPITEQTGLPFRSRNEGCMHACGHDVHMATVLGAASLLAEVKDKLPGRVRFIFQPAEEMPPGGARPMIESGALKDVSMIFGLHVDQDLPTGRIGLRDGPTMAAVIDFDLIIHGKAGHAARPHLAVDAVTTAAEVIQSVQEVVSRKTDPMTPVAVTFGTIEGGTARNVIADRVKLRGTARALSEKAASALPRLVKQVAQGVCRAHGAKVEMILIADYPVLKNDKRVNQLLQRNCESLFGKGRISDAEPGLGGEDFACYLQKVPGAMFRLGVGNKRIGADKPWHSPQFIVDEAAMTYGTALLAASVLD
ncbi:MAG: M20 family metallopeptidase, partial [Candidatus Zixiibacteriota bacterium]